LVISDKWQHRGIANKLMTALMDTARSRGLKMIQGEVLSIPKTPKPQNPKTPHN